MLIHNPKIILDGLVLYLDAANTKSYPGTGTTWYDLSGNGNNGVLSNVTFNSGNLGSMAFNSSSVSLGSTLLNTVPTGTISMWVKTTGAPAANGGQPWLNTTIFSNDNIYLGIQVLSNYIIRAYYWNTDATPKTVDSTTTTVLNTWVCVTYTWDIVSSNIYLNGIIDATSLTYTWTNVHTGHNDQINYLGSTNGGTYFYTGNLSTMQLYNKALSAAEVLQNFNALKSRYI